MPNITVHLLRHGTALCGYRRFQPPGSWPEGQKWHYPELAHQVPTDELCPICAAILELEKDFNVASND